MTRRQKEVLVYIRDHIEQHLLSPTYKEIGTALGITPPSVHTHVQALKKLGRVKMERYARYTITVVGKTITCPSCGHEFGV